MNEDTIAPFVATAIIEKEVTGAAIERRKPREATMAMEMMAQGETFDRVTQATGIGYSALVGLKVRHPETLEIRRKMLAHDGFQMAEALRQVAYKKAVMLAEDEDQLKKTSVKDLMIGFAIAQDKAFNALGEATVKVEHAGKRMTIEDAQRMIEDARATLKDSAIEVATNVTPVVAKDIGV
jgi:hypothetical protein